MMNDDWKQFCRTGSVEDYLKYRATQTQQEPESVDRKHAGSCDNHRADHKDITGWRVR